MSVQFGKCNFDGKPVDPKELEEVRPVLAPYGPDGEGYICKGNLGVLYRGFHTTEESRREIQPYVSVSDFVLTWDGRLDNRKELIPRVGAALSCESTDLEIVAAAYQRWGTDAFATLIGDWALSIWDPKDRSVTLAKDFVGTRPLYYAGDKDKITWSSIIDPLVLFSKHLVDLEEEYIAGWLTFFPATHLTPYVGIHSIPPASFVRACQNQTQRRTYWDFDPNKQIRYSSDLEYEEHFRTVLSQSVHRRLRSQCAVVAELSGGMDSSSIVCMADEIIGPGLADVPAVNTLSYYCNAEPNWNELPYITSVEVKRGRVGCHIDISPCDSDPTIAENKFAGTPACLGQQDGAGRGFASYLIAHGHRVLLSGLGGDEAMGGVPSPTPAIQDLLRNLQLRQLAQELEAWALFQRRPWLQLLWNAMREFAPTQFWSSGTTKTASWLLPDFAKRFQFALSGYERRLTLVGPRPSFQQNLATLEALRRHLGICAPCVAPPYEKRYPYLDRDLLEFVYAIPRDQVIRAGNRRSLQRRALRGIVPDEILNRRRKAYIVSGPMASLSAQYGKLSAEGMAAASLGIIDPASFSRALRMAHEGKEIPIVPLMRALTIEVWLRQIRDHVDWDGKAPVKKRSSTARLCPATAMLKSSASASHARQ